MEREDRKRLALKHTELPAAAARIYKGAKAILCLFLMEQNLGAADSELRGRVESEIWSRLSIYLLYDCRETIQAP